MHAVAHSTASMPGTRPSALGEYSTLPGSNTSKYDAYAVADGEKAAADGAAPPPPPSAHGRSRGDVSRVGECGGLAVALPSIESVRTAMGSSPAAAAAAAAAVAAAAAAAAGLTAAASLELLLLPSPSSPNKDSVEAPDESAMAHRSAGGPFGEREARRAAADARSASLHRWSSARA